MSKSRPQLRLQKVMADCGIASRRKCEEIILEGRVTVNEELVTTLGTKVDPFYDRITVDGELIDRDSVDKIYLVMNKPRGYVTTLQDPEGRRTIMDLCPRIKQRIYPVGRLDYLSEGLLILTNDGDMANKIMHPKFEVTKIYEVKVFGLVNEGLIQKLKRGVRFEDGLLRPSSVRVLEFLPKKTWLEFRLTEGKNREIRRLCEAVGLTIDKLRRVAIEGLSITGIQPGNYEFTTKKELYKKLGMDDKGLRKPTSKTSYLSPKKTIKIKDVHKRKKIFEVKNADDPVHMKYRKQTYYETLVQQKENKAKLEAEKAAQLS